MELIILGTGDATSIEYYNTCFMLKENGHCFLTDAGGGNGILRQLKLAETEIGTIRDIFVTHRHSDHLLGIFWLLRMEARGIMDGKYDGEFRIYAHEEVIRIIKTAAPLFLQEKEACLIGENGPIRLITVNDGESMEIMGRKTVFFDIHSTKAKQFGYMMETAPGEKLTCCGDEPYHESAYSYAYKSKWLLHEAFCLETEAQRFKPYEKHHSTVADACRNAQMLQAENLILYHTKDNRPADRQNVYMQEGEKYFSGHLWVPEDLDRFTL